MLHDSRQIPLTSVASFVGRPYEIGSLYDLIERFGWFLFRRSDFPDSSGSSAGPAGWCPTLLSALEVLRQKHGWTDRDAVRRASFDMQVKACLSIPLEHRGPSQPTLCRHRQRMQELRLDVVYLERLTDLLEALELLADDEPVVVDSVPLAGAGQQLDTYNLLAAAIRKGLSELAGRDRRPMAEVAAELKLEEFLSRSVKGAFDVDWDDEASRLAFLERLVSAAKRVRARLRQAKPRTAKSVRAGDDDNDNSSGAGAEPADSASDHGVEGLELGAAEIIRTIIDHDIECADDGTVRGIRQRRAGDRLISVTDPEMRHGRKSAAQLIAGYKVQIVASVVYGFILLARLIKANEHDGHALPRLVEELEARGRRPQWWGGDHAYGTLANHHFFDTVERGDLVARMPRPANGGRFTKDEFRYDFAGHELTCPAERRIPQTKWETRKGRKGRLFAFPASACRECPLRAQCVNPKASMDVGRSVFIVDGDERLIRAHLKTREEPEFQERLKKRPGVERVIAGFAQCGGKQAQSHGSRSAAFGANLSALAYNLRRLGSLMRADPQLAARAEQALRRAGAALSAIRALWRLVALSVVTMCFPSPREVERTQASGWA